MRRAREGSHRETSPDQLPAGEFATLKGQFPVTVEVGIPTLVGIATAAHFETTKVGVGIVSNPLEFVFLFDEDAAIEGDLFACRESSQSLIFHRQRPILSCCSRN